MLNALSISILDRYHDKRSNYAKRLGAASWGIIYQADVRARLECLEGLTRELAAKTVKVDELDLSDHRAVWAFCSKVLVEKHSATFWHDQVELACLMVNTGKIGVSDVLTGQAPTSSHDLNAASVSDPFVLVPSSRNSFSKRAASHSSDLTEAAPAAKKRKDSSGKGGHPMGMPFAVVPRVPEWHMYTPGIGGKCVTGGHSAHQCARCLDNNHGAWKCPKSSDYRLHSSTGKSRGCSGGRGQGRSKGGGGAGGRGSARG